MRISIDIDKDLLTRVKKHAGDKKTAVAVMSALRHFVQLKEQAGIRKLRGKIKWEGNLGELRSGRTLDSSGQKRQESLLEFFANSPLRDSGIDWEAIEKLRHPEVRRKQ